MHQAIHLNLHCHKLSCFYYISQENVLETKINNVKKWTHDGDSNPHSSNSCLKSEFLLKLEIGCTPNQLHWPVYSFLILYLLFIVYIFNSLE